jgi:acetyltransferase-like isoleucine patch superfamily enzyme
MVEPGIWLDGTLPPGVVLGLHTIVRGDQSFKRFQSRKDPAMVVGEHTTLDGVHFALGENARVDIGNFCYFSSAVLLSELELRIGHYVIIGWNATITDSDFHPISPAQRIADAVACSPLGENRRRPPVLAKPVVIGDEVWIGPNATILKGVRIGAGAFIEPGALVTSDVAPRSRVAGNPAKVIGQV